MFKKYFIFVLSKIFSIFIFKKINFKILMFHNINKKNFKNLEKTLKNLKKNYNFVDPGNLNKINGKNNILLTFDDGFLSNYIFAKSVLKKLGIKAIFFIVSDLLKDEKKKIILKRINDQLDPKKAKLMQINHIKDLLKLGHKIGAHGKSHKRLSKIYNYEVLYDEISRPKQEILKIFKINTPFFAYAYGDEKSINNKSIKIIKKKYKYLFTGIRGDNLKINHQKKIYFRDNIICNYPLSVINFFLRGFIDKYYYFAQKKILDL